MNTTPSHHILLIGLPGSGKTSFLGALWFMVNQTHIGCSLTLKTLDGDSKYPNEIRDAWLAYEPVPRNFVDKEKMVSMALKSRSGAGEVGLTFPDVSGESFRYQWAKRQLKTSFDALLRKASGGIMFVGPNTIIKPHLIHSVEELATAIEDPLLTAGPNVDAAQVVAKPWDIEKAPTQVQLVELLQIMSSRDHFTPRFRIAVVVSAWDELEGLQMTPSEYVSTELPLLSQFVQSNEDLFEFTFYGLSAQGARYASPVFTSKDLKDLPAFSDRLRRKADPVSAWLWEKLDPGAQAYLQPLVPDSGTLQTRLVENLNRIIAEKDFFDAKRYEEVTLRCDTKYLLNSAQRAGSDNPTKALRLNRLLLEDAYPAELSREWQHHVEDSELKQKPPARRVSVVGANVQNSHDLTEPIQWLMQ